MDNAYCCEHHRSFTAPVILPDEQLDHWGEVYLATPRLAARGVLFESFLAAPQEILAALAEVDAMQPQPLLAEQRAVRDRVDALYGSTAERGIERAIDALEHAGACRANGALIERLRHHAYPRVWPRPRVRRETEER